MRKVSRSLGVLVLAIALVAAPATALHARPAEDSGRFPHGALGLLHDLLRGWTLDRLWAGNEVSPTLDPNGRKVTQSAEAPENPELQSAPAGRQGTTALGTFRRR